MVDVFRYHEKSESTHRLLNPPSEAKVDSLGPIPRLRPGWGLFVVRAVGGTTR